MHINAQSNCLLLACITLTDQPPRLLVLRAASFRHGLNLPPSLLEPGDVCLLEFRVGWLSQIFAPGHSIRVTVSCTGLPLYGTLWPYDCLSVLLTAGIPVTCVLLRLCVVCRLQKLVATVPTRKPDARFTHCCTMDRISRMLWRQLLARPIVSTCAKGCSLTWEGGYSQRRPASRPIV